MIKIKISSTIDFKFSLLSEELRSKICKDLTLDNPKYIQADRRGYYTGNIDEFIHLYNIEDDVITLPRGYGSKLLMRLKDAGVAFEIKDKRLLLPSVDFGSKISLRDYQSPAVETLVKRRQGGVVAPCGSGKTIIMLEAMAMIGQPSLWICHTKELAYQTIERACQVLTIEPDEIGMIGDGKFSIGPRLTVALVQSLSRINIKQMVNKFGAILVDEAHHIAAPSFFVPIGQFPALYRLWASATPERSDGLTAMVYAGGGQPVHTINRSCVPTLTPSLVVIETNYDSFYGADEYPKLINDVVNDASRNNLIVKTIKQEAPGNYSLVLSDRVEHLNVLREILQKALPSLRIEILTGSMGKKARKDIMERVQAKQVDILLATQLAREGLDIIHLNRLFLTTPKRAASAVEQEVGRIMRPAPGKQDAIVYDFWDKQHYVLKPQFWKRLNVYKNLGLKRQPLNVRQVG